MRKKCEKCGQAFICMATNEDNNNCWCQSMTLNNKIPNSYKDCLCSTCLIEFSKPFASLNKKNNALQAEDYYYNDQGLMVFTKEYHLKRGYCCQSGCKHCPYQDKQISKNKQDII
jgi:hypothetical protein